MSNDATWKNINRYFRPLLRPYRRSLFLAVIAMALSAVLSVFRPWPLKVVIDLVLTNHPSRVPFLRAWLDQAELTKIQILWGACAATLVIAILTGVLNYYYTLLLGDTGERIVHGLRGNLFAHMQRLSLSFHDHQRTGDLTARLTSDINSLQDLLVNGIMVFGSNAITIVGMLALMLWMSWRLALISVAVTPLLYFVVFRYRQRIKLAAKRARSSTGMMASLAQEALASIRIVQGLGQEDQLDERFQIHSGNNLQSYLEGMRYQARITPIVDFLSAGGLTVVMWFGAQQVLAKQLSPGDVVIFFSYIASFYSPIKAVARFSFTWHKASIGAERIAEVLMTRSDVVERKDARPAPRLNGGIEFHNVSFEYAPGNPVLSEINLTLKPGEKIAIVGQTGAGKSTLVGLVPRFYDPIEGTVLFDGQDIRSFTLQSLRENISLVLQDSLLFSGTIRDNIAFGRQGASESDVLRAAKAAQADEFIDRLPEGYDTPVAERGTTLSGGQKQRIAIARAILRNAPILILDEPTSGLDSAVERAVMKALEAAAAGRTTLIIAHRLSTVRLADRIVVMESGKIIEEGTHAELLDRDGRYAYLFRIQAGVLDDEAELASDSAIPT
jgi:ATP-binding cassette, subfamily B, bacterial